MINFKNSTFIKSAPSVSERPSGQLPEVLIVGKSNVGKSSLINALCQKKSLAFTSSKPGHTKLLNYYNIDEKFYLVDAPGYGYAKGGVDLDRLFGQMMDEYFDHNEYLKLVLILLDARREFKDNDLEIVNFLKENQIPYFIVITKFDKVNQKEKAKLDKHLKEIGIAKDIFYTSALEVKTFDKLKKSLEEMI